MSDAGLLLAGKRVVIIGGASGIGFAVAQLAHLQGADIIIASSTQAKVETAAERLVGARGQTVDLREEANVANFFQNLGAFDHLAITAGDWGSPMFVSSRDLDLGQARDSFTVRFWGPLAAAKHCVRTIAPDGSITLTGGMLAVRPRPGAPLPTAVGGAIEHLARGLAMDLSPIRVNAVSPGLVLTEHVQKMPEEMLQEMVAHLPVPRAATPEEAARAYLYFMQNSYVTGQILPVDGGGMLV
ncbi:MAG TPA: SDR family oxidoreductase [Devosiaceae bacterium]|nr:SDR family oxidoreductase [Devosiaceae bacterium]